VILAPAVVGWVEKDKYVRRSGARPGDLILVTGRLGENPSKKHLVFQPRLREGRLLATRFSPTAMIDLSDGLFADLQKLCQASGAGAEIHAASLPVPAAAAGKGMKTILKAAGRGEEFELLFTLPPRRAKGLLQVFRSATGTEATVIGKILADRSRMELVGPEGKRERLPGWGWDHFAASAHRKGGGE
jgi:thiamine-monophosphate kinase